MKYRSVIVPRRGGPDVLEVVENDLRPPRKGEARIRVLAASVSLPDVEARYGCSPFPPKLPFTPGYSVVGDVEAIGQNGILPYKIGDRVAAFTVYGGYAEVVYFPVRRLIPVPAALDPAQVVPLILNYIVAYQTMHRVAKVEAGQTALIIGASGGIGTALLQLGRLAGLKLYGLASPGKHAILREYGATPLDYQSGDFVQALRQIEPGGLGGFWRSGGRWRDHPLVDSGRAVPVAQTAARLPLWRGAALASQPAVYRPARIFCLAALRGMIFVPFGVFVRGFSIRPGWWMGGECQEGTERLG